jgi:hypothetical protein
LNSSFVRQYANNGQHAQQLADYTLTGKIRKPDKIPYNVGSDIPELKMSIKSAKFSLMSGSLCKAQDFNGIIQEFFENVVSTSFGYVSKNEFIYIMNAVEFREFVERFCYLSYESSSNGKRNKIKMYDESKKVIEWLMLRA